VGLTFNMKRIDPATSDAEAEFDSPRTIAAITAAIESHGHTVVPLEATANLPRLLAELPTTRLVVAGDGDDRPRLEARAAALGLAPQVCFTGFVSEATLGELYRRAALFVMPSRGEGFGLVYLEAMRAGKPCVAARASAAAEIVADQETGLLVDPEDPADLAAALGRLLADPELARAMGERGRRRGERLFTPERFRQRLWPLLERLTGEPDVRHQRHP